MKHSSDRPTLPAAVRRPLALALAAVTATTLAAGATVRADDPAEQEATTPTTTVAATTTVATPSTPPSTQAPATTTAPTTTTAPVSTPAPSTTVTTPPATVPPTTVPAPAPRNVIVPTTQIAHILATIRYVESRGNYTVPPNKGNASGAYQYIQSAWNNYGGYAHAYLAPPWMQDERALADVERIMKTWNNDVSMVPVNWYLPAAARNPALMDIVPKPSAGNVLTIREYQIRWLGVYSFISGLPIPPIQGAPDYVRLGGLPPQVPVVEEHPSIAFPVLGPSAVAAPNCDDAESDVPRADVEAAGLCADAAPGIVFGVKLQPVLVVADGVVTAVDDLPGSGRPIAVEVTDESGRVYRYSGFNDDNLGTADGQAPAHLRLSGLASVGSPVRAGQVIGYMGDTDPLPLGVRAEVPTDRTVTIDPAAVAPHIRITMRTIDGEPIDTYGPLIDALFRQTCTVAIGPWSAPPNGTGHDEVTLETTDDQRTVDSEWVYTADGQVTAAGWAAMINPSESCGGVSGMVFGPGAAGLAGIPDGWLDIPDLPTSMWIRVAITEADDNVSPLIRL